MKNVIVLTGLLAAAGFAGFVEAQAQTDIREGLVSYWPFEILEGNATPDICSSNHLLLQGTMTATNFIAGGGRFGNGFYFGGANQCLGLTIMNSAAAGLPVYHARRYTVALWVKGPSASANNNRGLFAEANTNSTTPLMLVGTRSSSTPREPNIFIRGSSTFVSNVFPTNTVLDNDWHHVAWVDDLGSARIYVDGILATNFSYTQGPISLSTIAVGGALRTNGVTLPFTGYIDEVGVWERPLSQSEIQAVMNAPISTPVPAFAPFVNVPPAGSTNALGDRLTLSVIAGGTRPLFYQWHKGGVPIPGATEARLVFTNLSTLDSANYTVTISNAVSNVTSTAATVLVNPDPVPDLANGIVSYWPFDTGTTTTPDPYGRNDMALNQMDAGSFVPRSEVQFTNALQFNGANQYLHRVDGAPIYNQPVYTVAFWVNGQVAQQTNRAVFSEGCSTNATPYFSLGTDNNASNAGLNAFIRNSANVALVNHRKTASTVFDGNWHHVVWTDSNGVVKVYIDGFLDATDFNYAREALPLDVTGVGAILRASATNFFAGMVDELAVWSRRLSYTEIQQLITSGMPYPSAAVAPAITVQPVGTNVYTGANITLFAIATGTSPLVYRWFRDGAPLASTSTNTLSLTAVRTNDSGAYTLVVTNEAGSATSAVANVTVTLRPPAPEFLAIDFNERVAQAPLETGFQSFVLGGTNQQTVPTLRLFGGTEVQVRPIGSGNSLDDRVRPLPTNSAAFTQENLLRDFVYSTSTSAGTGLEVLVSFLRSNQLYRVTVWCFDQANGGNRVSDWWVNDALVRDNYAFNGSILPASNEQYQFTVDVLSDANGRLKLEGRLESGGVAVFLNALRIAIPPPAVTSVTADGSTVTLVYFTPNPEVTAIQSSGDIAGNWETLDNVTPTPAGPNLYEVQLPQPAGHRFYRLVRGSLASDHR